MNDALLFYTGVFVFGLMLVGVVFTVLEFRQLGRKDEKRSLENQNSKGSD
jgi:hypothetical protein